MMSLSEGLGKEVYVMFWFCFAFFLWSYAKC